MSARVPTRFGWWLQEQMRRKDLTQTDLAHKMGVGQATISRWTLQDLRPEPVKLDRLAEVLELGDDERAEMFRRAGHGSVAAAVARPDGYDEDWPVVLVEARRMLLPSSPLSDQDRRELDMLLDAVVAKWRPLMVQRRRRSI